MVSLLLLGGCAKGYKEGIYTGTATDSYGGQDNTATATVTVDSNGKVTYNPYGSTIGEWDTQVKALEDYIVKNQGIDSLKLDEDGKTDAVSGCTIKIDALYEAASNALKQAKK